MQKQSYSESIKEIDSILEDLENNELQVDTLTKKVERAATLIKQCKDQLTKTNEDVKKILDSLDE